MFGGNPNDLYRYRSKTKRVCLIFRALTGGFGASVAVTQYWANEMFASRIVSTVSSLVGGWMESGMAHVLIGTILFPIFKSNVFHGDADLAWRFVLAVPPLLAFVTGVMVYFFTDDTPRGNLHECKPFERNGRHHIIDEKLS